MNANGADENSEGWIRPAVVIQYIQHSFASNFLVETSYVGTKGHTYLIRARGTVNSPYLGAGAAQDRRPNRSWISDDQRVQCGFD